MIQKVWTNLRQDYYITLVFWYCFFGAFHELAHISAAVLAPNLELSNGLLSDGFCLVVWKIIFERHCVIPYVNNLNQDDIYTWLVVNFIRHIAWITSVLIALKLNLSYCTKNEEKNEHNFSTLYKGFLAPILLAANITALEAISTDLLGLPVLPFFSKSIDADSGVFFCGNFGAILINPGWLLLDGGKSALELIEKMVNVTQMRGAQSGGVITFFKSKQSQNQYQLAGIRSRVVNKKRSDLSKEIRKKLQSDIFPNFISRMFTKAIHSKEFVHAFVGHTRFATSSKATFEGTHPHRFSTPTRWKIYNFFLGSGNNTTVMERNKSNNEPILSEISVENYITHNGDFDFFEINGKTYELTTILKWLEIVTNSPIPSAADSVAIAGLVDLFRVQGSFGLSIRYAICFGLSTSKITEDPIEAKFPTQRDFEKVGYYFEEVLNELLKSKSLSSISDSEDERHNFAKLVSKKLQNNFGEVSKEIRRYITDDEGGANLFHFITVTIDAFFDYDLFYSTKKFLSHAKGSFGLCVTSSLDAHRQICLAARGQTISIAFYPTKGLICYGSEQAAVKAGMNIPFPGKLSDVLGKTHLDIDNDDLRLDLDSVGGEICLLDWGMRTHVNQAISACNQNIVSRHRIMNGSVNVYLYQESKTTKQSPLLYHRMTRLTRNEFIKPLKENVDDLVLQDIQDIPKVCQAIQDDWRHIHKETFSLNRLSAWTLARCVRRRLDARISGSSQSQVECIDILLTGCEVSLWLAEQFASDLQKSFPNLRIKAVSSNKLLALYGQEVTIPTTGYPMSQKTQKIQNSIVIIISHSGGTFSPLACSSLLQSFTKNIFVVTSEWDTQIGKQLRRMNGEDDQIDVLFNSHIFTTEVGMRPAEPSSVSVAATQQLLTNIFEHICLVILSSHEYRHSSGAVITERDLKVLERCNILNIKALESIVGVDIKRNVIFSEIEKEIRKLGDIWAEHILENAKAYIMSFFYIFVTVTVGYPVFTLIAKVSGVDSGSSILYLVHFLDAIVYFYLPQINVIILRLIQKRNLLHRMVGRTVVIGDIPWVAQAGEAFLSKLFACSYSIAGLNVLSGNPSDHLVHRHTHRVVRGTLFVCGRQDGRLSSLSSSETAVCLSINQACSIQSIGGTCECITIGHNPFKVPLSAHAVILDRHRPMFLCERFLAEYDKSVRRGHQRRLSRSHNGALCSSLHGSLDLSMSIKNAKREKSSSIKCVEVKGNQHFNRRSSSALMGAYKDLEKQFVPKSESDRLSIEGMAWEVIQGQRWSNDTRTLFEVLDVDGDGVLDIKEFVTGFNKLSPSLSRSELFKIFEEADVDESGGICYKEFSKILEMNPCELDALLHTKNRDSRGLIQVEASNEYYFGEKMRKAFAFNTSDEDSFLAAIKTQNFSQELYESRIASLQRFVAMTVMFHQMGKRVQSFFPRISFGLLGYRIDRTHSVMRIASTASPISGAEVRERMYTMQLTAKINHSINVISNTWIQYKQKQKQKVF